MCFVFCIDFVIPGFIFVAISGLLLGRSERFQVLPHSQEQPHNVSKTLINDVTLRKELSLEGVEHLYRIKKKIKVGVKWNVTPLSWRGSNFSSFAALNCSCLACNALLALPAQEGDNKGIKCKEGAVDSCKETKIYSL